MLDLGMITSLVASATPLVLALVQKAVDKGAEEVGKASAAALLDKLKAKLGHAAAKEALDDLRCAPLDPAAAGAFEMQLRKAVAGDEALYDFLKEFTATASQLETTTQHVTALGNANKVAQTRGDGNSVNIS